jgi:acyl-coenzyme A thioesterase PaaI-like protein
VLNAGRRVATAEARITDAKDRLLAHATTTCLVLAGPSTRVIDLKERRSGA